jgi:phosphoribosyl 1,2-cyclic phosphodiesterase
MKSPVVCFWGTRGSAPCPEPSHAKYGGHTSCIDVIYGDHHIVFDAGTGLQALDRSLAGVGHIDLLLSHTHFDHVCGFPHFKALFNPNFSCHIRAGHLPEGEYIEAIMAGLMEPPYFPMPMSFFNAQLSFTDFRVGERFILGSDIRVGTIALNHTNGATGYRLDGPGLSVCYITDIEHDGLVPDPDLATFVSQADLLIYDCSYTDEEYDAFAKGRGHSTWQAGMRLAKAGSVGNFAIFHHDPAHDDIAMDAIAAEAMVEMSNCFVARDGLVWQPA